MKDIYIKKEEEECIVRKKEAAESGGIVASGVGLGNCNSTPLNRPGFRLLLTCTLSFFSFFPFLLLLLLLLLLYIYLSLFTRTPSLPYSFLLTHCLLIPLPFLPNYVSSPLDSTLLCFKYIFNIFYTQTLEWSPVSITNTYINTMSVHCFYITVQICKYLWILIREIVT